MITTLVPVTLNPPVGGPPRSEGIHLSKVIRGIAVESRILDPKYAASLALEEVGGETGDWWETLDVSARIRIALGMAWESWYIPNLGTIADHPGEMQLDGIYMTHDGESVDVLWGNDFAIHEVKATYKSTKTVGDLSTQWMWIQQVKGYCKGKGICVCYLHVLFLCGDYKYPITPQIGPVKGQSTAYRIEFTQAEIDASWDDNIAYVQYRQRQDREDAGLEGV